MCESYLIELQDELRRDLGLRAETRLDNIIFRDGSAYTLQPDGVLELVRYATGGLLEKGS